MAVPASNSEGRLCQTKADGFWPRDNARPAVAAWGSGRSPVGNRQGAHVRASRARRGAMGSPRSGHVGFGA